MRILTYAWDRLSACRCDTQSRRFRTAVSVAAAALLVGLVAPVVAASPAEASEQTTQLSGSLAFTGTDVALTITLGAAAIGVGGMVVLAARRRHTPTA